VPAKAGQGRAKTLKRNAGKKILENVHGKKMVSEFIF
jgi:hypothetical protein